MSAAPTAPLAPGTPFVWTVRVYWEDTDAGGIVYYANYLKFFERARTEWLRSLGVQQRALRATSGGQFVVSQAQLHYLQSARLDDELLLTTTLLQAGRASLTLAQQALRQDKTALVLLAQANIRAGWVNADSGKAGRIPPLILDRLKK